MSSLKTDKQFDAAAAANVLLEIRRQAPKLHCLTSPVAQLLTANALLALGAQPSLSWSADEIDDFVASSDGVLLNLGMLIPEHVPTLDQAAKTANDQGKPWVLDPVYAYRSAWRFKVATSLIERSPTAVKANATEMNALASYLSSGSTRLTTADVDIIRSDTQEARIYNGSPFMAQSTAMGCALGAVVAAALTVEKRPFVAVASSALLFAVAGQMAAKLSAGPGSFVPNFIDALASITADDVIKIGHMEYKNDN